MAASISHRSKLEPLPPCEFLASAPLSLSPTELFKVVQIVINFIKKCRDEELTAVQIEKYINKDSRIRRINKDTTEVLFFQDGNRRLAQELHYHMLANISMKYMYGLIHYLMRQGPFIVRFFLGLHYDPLSLELVVIYDDLEFVIEVASRDDCVSCMISSDPPPINCSLELLNIDDGSCILDLLERKINEDFIKVLGQPVLIDSPPIIYKVPVVTASSCELPIALHQPITSLKEFYDAIMYFLSYNCIQVVELDKEKRHEEVVCNTGNFASQQIRWWLYKFPEFTLRGMRFEEKTLRLYIGSEKNIIAVDFCIIRDEYGNDTEYQVTYLISPKLVEMTKKKFNQHFREETNDYLNSECDMEDRLIRSMLEQITPSRPFVASAADCP